MKRARHRAMDENRMNASFSEQDALLEWVRNSIYLLSKGGFMRLCGSEVRFVYAVTRRSCDFCDSLRYVSTNSPITDGCSDNRVFDLHPIDHPGMSVLECKTNLDKIVNAIILYYDQEKGWTLESNIPIDPIFDAWQSRQRLTPRNDPGSLVLIVRWVITTILFSSKKTHYISTILSLSPQTQMCLQCIIEAVMNSFPLDDENSASLSEMHSLVEDSILSTDSVRYRRDSLDDNGAIDAHDPYDEEIGRLEAQIQSLQQSLGNRREEAEALRRQRDDLQQEVAAKKEVIRGLEGQERRRSTAVESQWEALKGEITSLKRERELLGVGVGGGREA